MIPGIDVSHWNGVIDWPTVAAAGIQFAIIAAGDRDGEPLDPQFAANWGGARAAGLVRGAYWFARPSMGPPEADALAFLAALETVGGFTEGDLAALDLEDPAARGPLAAWALTWLGTVEQAAGFKPLLYSSPSYLAEHDCTDPALGEFGLWIAHYGVPAPAEPAPWPFWAVWQYTDTGAVAGVLEQVDRDFFNGDDVARLRLYGAPPPADPCAGQLAELRNSLSTITTDRDRLAGILAAVKAAVEGV